MEKAKVSLERKEYIKKTMIAIRAYWEAHPEKEFKEVIEDLPSDELKILKFLESQLKDGE